ncbi:MAG: hypothetical protein H6551_02150 [Chitinophagales bacterium]|nr:hypothetical protein [Chitinophagaceae bacterium]MCB9063926.1 hypothetical protein [Chitinophagales bacterium]
MKFLSNLFKSSKIEVNFIDNSTGQSMGVSHMEPSQLPETFSVPTRMHIHEEEWLVEEAIPENAADFINTRKLILKLKRVEQINTDELLFTIPAVSNDYPPLSSMSEYAGEPLVIHEDEWRQKEFLKPSSVDNVNKEFEQINNIIENSSVVSESGFVAFRECHARNIIEDPELEIEFSKLMNFMHVAEMQPLQVNGEFVTEGFSFKTTGTGYYGTVKNGIVTRLSISNMNTDSYQEVRKIIEEFGVIYVDWCRCELIQKV